MNKCLLFFLLVPQLTFASALVVRDDEAKEIRVIARMNYHGEAATAEIAELATREISEMWNEPEAMMNMAHGEQYRIKFEIDYTISQKIPVVSASCAHNIIAIRNKSRAGDYSYYSKVGASTGTFYTSDGLGTSTTAAHEFGHGLMLDHDPLDQRKAEVPGIMFPRGTLVRPEFQWISEAAIGQKGATLKPHHRKVRAEDIKSIPWNRVRMEKNMGCLGDGTALPI